MLRLASAALTAWWWSLTFLGAWIVPALFVYLPTKATAGNMAAYLFSQQTWIAIVCGLLLLALGRAQLPSPWKAWLVTSQPITLGAMLFAVLLEFSVAPHIVARDNLALWHKVGTGLMVGQWLLTGWMLWQMPHPSSRNH